MQREIALPRPALRGWVHLVSAVVSFTALWPMLFVAESDRAMASALVLGISSVALFGTSASYHLAPWRDGARRVMKRLDHAMIFVAVAGFFTPFCLVAMSERWGLVMLGLTWGLAAAGAVTKLLRPDLPRWLGTGMYLGLGWLPAIAAGEVAGYLPVSSLLGVLAAGLVYSLGGVLYATRWPNPAPRVFGFHEAFHVCTAIGTAILWVVVARALLA